MEKGSNHYKGFKMEPIDIIKEYALSFSEGNVIKYILRYKQKGGPGSESRISDLKKAKHYIELLIEEEKSVPLPPEISTEDIVSEAIKEMAKPLAKQLGVQKSIEIPAGIKPMMEELPKFGTPEFKEYVSNAVTENKEDIKLTLPFVKEMIKIELDNMFKFKESPTK